MTKIRIDTQQVRTAAREMATRSDQLSDMGHGLQQAIASLDTWAWDGVSRARAEPMLGQVRSRSYQVAQKLDELACKLQRVADVFEQEDTTAAQNLSGMPWVDFAAGAAMVGLGLSVLPVTGPGNVRYETMTWKERQEHLKRLVEEIGRSENLLGDHRELMRKEGVPEDLTVEEVDNRLEAIDDSIESLRAALASAQESRDDWRSALFGTRDDIDRDIQALQEQLTSLEGERDQLQHFRELLVREDELEGRLAQAIGARNEFTDRIANDPNPWNIDQAVHELRPAVGTEGLCLGYAEARRPDLDPNHEFSHAFHLIDGYSAQNPPVMQPGQDMRIDSDLAPGMALVWDKGAGIGNGSVADPTSGHVAIIEQVHSDHVVLSDQGGTWELSWSEMSAFGVNENVYIIP